MALQPKISASLSLSVTLPCIQLLSLIGYNENWIVPNGKDVTSIEHSYKSTVPLMIVVIKSVCGFGFLNARKRFLLSGRPLNVHWNVVKLKNFTFRRKVILSWSSASTGQRILRPQILYRRVNVKQMCYVICFRYSIRQKWDEFMFDFRVCGMY